MKVKVFPTLDVRDRIEREFLAQSMRGLWRLSHGRPRMISSLPRSVIKNRCREHFPLIFRGLSEKEVMSPALFGEPSTLCGSMGWLSLWMGMWCFLMIVEFTKTPCAPESTRAVRGTSLPWDRIKIGMRIELLVLLVTEIRETSRLGGGTCAHGFLLSENPSPPVHQIAHQTPQRAVG